MLTALVRVVFNITSAWTTSITLHTWVVVLCDITWGIRYVDVRGLLFIKLFLLTIRTIGTDSIRLDDSALCYGLRDASIKALGRETSRVSSLGIVGAVMLKKCVTRTSRSFVRSLKGGCDLRGLSVARLHDAVSSRNLRKYASLRSIGCSEC